MDGLSLVPFGAAIPERVIVYPPLFGDQALTVLALVLSIVLLRGAIRYRHQLRRQWRRWRNRPQLRPAHV